MVVTTDGAGQFSLDVAEGTIVAAALAGLATVSVDDQTGLATSAEVPAEAVTNISIGEPGNVLSVANNTAYFFTDQTLAFLNQNGVEDPALLDLTTNTNISDSCNAFYTQSSINFFQAGSVSSFDCNNTAEATIVMHEYGHFVDDVFGGITNGGLSEGWGDLLACLITAAPDVGPDFFVGDDPPLRTCDNDYPFFSPPPSFTAWRSSSTKIWLRRPRSPTSRLPAHRRRRLSSPGPPPVTMATRARRASTTSAARRSRSPTPTSPRRRKLPAPCRFPPASSRRSRSH